MKDSKKSVKVIQNILWRLFYFGLSGIILIGCSSTSTPPRQPLIIGQDRSESPKVEWTLVWSDEFEGEAGETVNQENWVFDLGGHGWGNQQLEFNTDRPKNASLNGNGLLQITAHKEDYQGNSYTCLLYTSPSPRD